MATEVPGAEALGEAVREATARKGWRQSELERRSREAMLELDGDATERSRVGLSNRTWQDLWRGSKRIEMESYSYAVIDQTLGWTRGTAWAIHHGQEPPEVSADALDELRAEVDELRAEVRGLVEMLPSLLGRVGRRE